LTSDCNDKANVERHATGLRVNRFEIAGEVEGRLVLDRRFG